MKPIRKIALTGASGMVGRHIMDHVAKRGIGCIATSRSCPNNMPSTVIWRKWDLSEWLEFDELDALLSDVDALLHVGALVPRKSMELSRHILFDANVRSCLNLGLWAFRTDIPVVYLSSAAVYKAPEAPRIKETEELAHYEVGLGGFYGFSKLLGETVLNRLVADGLHLCILRASSIYGTGLAADQMISIFLNRAMNGQEIDITAHPESRINLLHAADVAEACLRVLEKGVVGTFNVGNSRMFTIREIAQAVLRVCRRKDDAMCFLHTSSEPYIRYDLDCSAAEKAFGFRPRISLEEGLRLMKEEKLVLS